MKEEGYTPEFSAAITAAFGVSAGWETATTESAVDRTETRMRAGTMRSSLQIVIVGH
jgi:hypothetical protein